MRSKVMMSFRRLLGNAARDNVLLVVPVYDDETRAVAGWLEEPIQEVRDVLVGERVGRPQVIEFLKSGRESKLLLFFGHGLPTGLLMEPNGDGHGVVVGKNGEKHKWLVVAEDFGPDIESVSVAAWACFAGETFGERVGQGAERRFLGFNGSLDFSFGDPSCDELWGSLARAFFKRVAARGAVRPEDVSWLRETLAGAIRELRTGARDTGVYNLFNRLALRNAARSVVGHPEA